MSWHAPADPSELAALLEELGEGEAPVLPTGAPAPEGEGGPAADVPAETVSTAELAGIREHRPRDLTVTVGAGTRVAELRAFLQEEGGWLPVGGPALEASAGGLVAGGLAGPYDGAYGALGRQVLACRVVTHRGTEARWGRAVMKNVAGYDMPRMATGSFGRLGVLHEVTFRLWPAPERRRTLALAGGDDALGAAGRLLGEDLDASVRPDAVVWRPGRLEVRLLGSAASVEAREDRLRARAGEAGLEVVGADDGPREPSGRTGEGGRSRPVGESVVGLTVSRTGFVAAARAALGELGEALAAAEGYPLQGFLRLWYRRRPEAPSPLGALGEACPHASLRLERGTEAELEGTRGRRDPGVRRIEDRLVRALEGRPRHWLASYL